MVTPRFLAVPFLVEQAPLMTTMVASLASFFAARLGLATSPVPIDVDGFEYLMVWHASYDGDPVHRWLRQLVYDAAVTMRSLIDGNDHQTKTR